MKVTSILKKTVMALTGLAWIGFLLVHLAGNFQIFSGFEKFNTYAELLKKAGGLLYVAEAGLVLFLVLHAFSGIRVTLENKAARPTAYVRDVVNGDSTIASRTMWIGGLILAAFIVVHVGMFKFGNASGPKGLWGLVVESFHNPAIVAFYVIAMLALGLHLSHGFQSAFQTLGALKPAWRPRFKSAGAAIGWIVALGFATLPIWAFVTNAG